MLIDTNGRACITDFGLSMVLDEIGSTLGTSSAGKWRATLRWAAPELLDLTDDANTGPTIPSDIYSFGGTMLQVRGVEFRIALHTHDGLSRFCLERSRITIIPAMCRSLLHFSEGRHPCGRTTPV